MKNALTEDRITEALHRGTPFRMPGRRRMHRSGVALVLGRQEDNREYRLLYIKRARRSGDPWSGHVSFPGGRGEPGDANVFATAGRELLEETGLGAIDSIVCGLPWAVFDEELQDSLLNATLDSLKPGGQFATFAYLQGLLLPAGKRFKEKLAQSFSKVETSPTVWRNLPPAFVYRCTK